MRKYRLLPVVIILLFAFIFGSQLSTLLKAMPSRYVARLPEAVQALGQRGGSAPILPTVMAPSDTSLLLTPLPSPTTTSTPFVEESPTPLHDANAATMVLPTITPIPTATNTPIPIPTSARLDGFVHQFQTWNNCGPATIAMALSYYDLTLDQNETAEFLKPNPEDRNVSPYQMVDYVKEKTPYSAIDRTNGDLETIKRLVASGFPTIIELGIEPPGEYRWLGWYGHYLLVVAYDDESEQFWFYDSWFGTSDVPMENATVEGRIFHYAEIDEQWRQFNRNYIVLYQEDQAVQVTNIIGDNMDDSIMWTNSLQQNQLEVQQRPDDAFSWLNLGHTYTALEQYELAAEAFDKARSIGLPWRMLWYLFSPYEAYYQVARYEDVILLADITLQDRPYFEESFFYKGLALAALGDIESARENIEKSVNFNPNFLPATSALENDTIQFEVRNGLGGN